MYVCTNTVEEEEEERVRENRQFHAYERGAHVAGKLETRILYSLHFFITQIIHYVEVSREKSFQPGWRSTVHWMFKHKRNTAARKSPE